MSLIILILLFVGAVLLAVGICAPADICAKIGSILLAVGFGIQLFSAVV